MQKIVIDTNVIVSALIQRNYPYLIVNNFITECKYQLCISDDLIKEYKDVLNRKKFSKYKEFAENAKILITYIELKSVKYIPQKKLNIINDIDDNKLLELVEECNADFLITGNTNDFTMKTYKRTRIVTPKEYWETHLL